MKRTIGVICMLLGACLVFGALGLMIYNSAENSAAEDIAAEYLPQVLDRLPPPDGEDTLTPPQNSATEDSADSIPEDAHDKLNSYVGNMLATEIEGYSFVGCISVPSLDINLPVLSETSKALLKKFPCRFSGSPKTQNLVIGAHNYPAHFGNISDLAKGDEIVFTDMEGNVWRYAVEYQEILLPQETEALIQSGHPLTIYTCNYDGSKRITIRCNLLK